MSVKRILTCALVVCALAALLPVSGYAAQEADDWTIYLRPAIRFGTDNRVLFVVDALAPVYRGADDIVFINTKFTPDNHEGWEINAGVGYRKMLSDRLVLGGNFFYDHRKTRYGSHFDQIGLGFEAMAEVNGVGLTTRFNYYQPLTKAKIGSGFAHVFYGNGIYASGIEEPLTGFDYEAGVRIPWVSNYVETWAYAGGYNFFGCHTPYVSGVSARLEAIPSDFMRLGFEYRNDNINHDEFYGEVAFEVPFSIENLVAGKNPFAGIGDVLTGSRTLKERMVEPVRRDVDIVVENESLDAGDGSDGKLVAGAIFVADNATGGGDGSFEHPYDSLDAASVDVRLGDTISIVHVLAGDGSGLVSEGTFYFDQPGITIWGAGANNPAYPNVANFAQGYPVLYSSLMINAQNMTVLGLYFDEPAGEGITIGSGAAGAGLSIFSNIIDGAQSFGISYAGPDDLGAPGAPALIWGNTITSVEDGGGDSAGIGLYSYHGSVYARVFDNLIADVEGDAHGIRILADEGDFIGDISGNEIYGINGYDAYGIRVDASGDIDATISQNLIAGIWGEDSAMGIDPDCGGDFVGSIVGNTLYDIESEYYASGIDVDAEDSFIGSIRDNSISGIESVGSTYGIFVAAYDDLTGSISGNTVEGIYADYDYVDAEAYGIYAYTTGEFGGSITGNRIYDIYSYSEDDDAESYGIYAESMGDFSGSITSNSIEQVEACEGYDTAAYGIYAVSEYGDFLGTISSNTIDNILAEHAYEDAEAYGIYAYGDDFSGSISSNKIMSIWATESDEGVYAYGIFGKAADTFTGSISNNTINGVWAEYSYDYAEAYGIHANAGFLNNVISGNTINDVYAVSESSDGYAYGIYAYGHFGSTVDINRNTISEISGMLGGYGIYSIANSMEYSGDILNNRVSGIYGFYAAYGIYADAYSSPFGVFTGTVSGNTVSDVTAPGGTSIGGIFVRSGGDFLGSISDNTISGITGTGPFVWGYWPNGICAFVVGDFDGTITGNTIDNVTNTYVGGAYGPGFADGIMVGYYGNTVGGTISRNTITNIHAAMASGIYLGDSGDPIDIITTAITDNVIEVDGSLAGYGLYAEANRILLTYTGNTGTIDAPTAYAAYLEAFNPAASDVTLGHGASANSFTITGIWGGNYPFPGGSIWATDNGSFIH